MRPSRLIVVSLCLLMLAAVCVAQSAAPAQPQKPKELSNEDLQNLNGAVNVVGESDSWKEPPPADPTNSLEHAAVKPPERASDENCNSRGLAMAISAALRNEGVTMGTGDVLDRLYGGDICKPDLGNVPVLIRRMEGDFTLSTGRRISIAVAYRDGPPPAAELVENNGKNRHYIFFVQGIAYLHTGVDYSEQAYFDGYSWGRYYVTNAIDLLDPYRNRTVIFRRREIEIEGSMLFTVSARQ